MVRGRVNGGPPLRLLLDSGSRFVVLSRRPAAKSGCSGGDDFELIGAGARSAKVAKFLRAETIAIDDFVARSVKILVTDEPLADGVDGVVPLTLFRGFLMRLNASTHSLDLEPYPPERARQPGELEVIEDNDLLFVKCHLNGSRDACFLLDTGASYNAISLALARELSSPDLMNHAISLQGGTAALQGRLTRVLTNFRVGARELVPDPMVVIDLSLMSRYHQMEISGLIGFPALRESVLAVNYRDGRIRIDSGSASHAR